MSKLSMYLIIILFLFGLNFMIQNHLNELKVIIIYYALPILVGLSLSEILMFFLGFPLGLTKENKDV